MGYQLKPPFEIYHGGTEIADANGHLCSAEGPEEAQAILEALNGHDSLEVFASAMTKFAPDLMDELAARWKAATEAERESLGVFLEVLRSRP